MTTTLTKDQEVAASLIREWFESGTRTHFKLGGLAGTGKTHLIAHLADYLKIPEDKIAFMAFTGKAASVMRRKGLKAGTIHSSIYEKVDKMETAAESETRKRHLELTLSPKLSDDERDELEDLRETIRSFDIRRERDSKKPEWYLMPTIGKSTTNPLLAVVDEASMISQVLHDDLLSFGVPVLYVGDFFQLPPVGDQFNLMEERGLDYAMTKIMRQALDNPIIQVSMSVREGHQVPYQISHAVCKIHAKDVNDKYYEIADQVICGTNNTRTMINDMVRERMGHNGLPKKGEKIIFLKNAKMVGIFNGQQGMLSKDFEYDSHQNRYSGDMNYVNMDDIDDHDRAVEVGNRLKRLMKRTPDWRGHDEGVSWNDDGSYSFQRSNGTSVKLWHPAELESLHNRKVDVSIRKLIQLTDRRGREEPMRAWEYGLPTFDFGYALTCHKAQGSEWDCVLVYDEGVGSGVMRDPMMRRRWLYTAVTRAKEQLLWVVGGDGNNRYR